jgi:SanA protein
VGLRTAAFVLLAALVAVPALRFYTVNTYRAKIVAARDAPAGRVAIVFGAGIVPTGEPSSVLLDRLATAADLYQSGKVTHVILSGDGSDRYHDEPEVMQRAILQLGVPDSAVRLDRAGIRTRETCRHAFETFGLASATLVTQAFHLPRALMLCESFGIDVVGVPSDRGAYPARWRLSWQLRETAATTVAWLEIATHIPARTAPMP